MKISSAFVVIFLVSELTMVVGSDFPELEILRMKRPPTDSPVGYTVGYLTCIDLKAKYKVKTPGDGDYFKVDNAADTIVVAKSLPSQKKFQINLFFEFEGDDLMHIVTIE